MGIEGGIVGDVGDVGGGISGGVGGGVGVEQMAEQEIGDISTVIATVWRLEGNCVGSQVESMVGKDDIVCENRLLWSVWRAVYRTERSVRK